MIKYEVNSIENVIPFKKIYLKMFPLNKSLKLEGGR